MGKPSPQYFYAALETIECKIEDGFYMIGDDIENDILAAQNIDGMGILIYTGKTKFPLEISFGIKAKF
ncbi:MAG: HAD-IA family hydrolase [Ignavibacteriales bacterium]|nr:HAD-IA family hydrolase [Ignavibacteriales bacterium]